MIKNAALIAVIFSYFLAGCSREKAWDDDIAEISDTAIDSVSLAADTVALGSSVAVNTYTSLQAGCESFYRFNYTTREDSVLTREITAVKLRSNSSCGRVTPVPADFSFTPQSAGSYRLKFRSASGWITKRVVVQ